MQTVGFLHGSDDRRRTGFRGWYAKGKAEATCCTAVCLRSGCTRYGCLDFVFVSNMRYESLGRNWRGKKAVTVVNHFQLRALVEDIESAPLASILII